MVIIISKETYSIVQRLLTFHTENTSQNPVTRIFIVRLIFNLFLKISSGHAFFRSRATAEVSEFIRILSQIKDLIHNIGEK